MREDLPNLKLNYTPAYSPFISQGVAMRSTETQVGKNMFSSRNALRNTIVH
ncbi:hypothetical protein [Tahibacter aquaticus]|uniref:hypothetical protein n=1 Tax=Tahibacter aquaticus TaxID=520092 RepID=UPI003CE4E3CC